MSDATARKNAADLAKLLRFLLAAGEARLEGEGTLAAPGGRAQSVSPEILGEALSLGLVRRDGNLLAATPEARAHLRRRLCETETPFAGQHRERAPRRGIRHHFEPDARLQAGRLHQRRGERLTLATADHDHVGLEGEQRLQRFRRQCVDARHRPVLDQRVGGQDEAG